MADKTMSLITQLSLNDEAFKKSMENVKGNVKSLIDGVKTASGNVGEFNQALNKLKGVSFAGKSTEEIKAVNTRVKELSGNLKTLRAEQGASSTGGGMLGGLGSLVPAVAIGAVVAGVMSFGEESVKAADEAAKANRKLLFSVGGNREEYEKLVAQANKLRDATGIDDEAIKQIQQLGAGADYSTDRIMKLTSASIELSKKTGMDLQAAYMQLNTTLSGSVGRLKRVDPEFASLTKEQLKNGAAIDLVNSKYGGFAANAASSADKASVSWLEFKKAVGGAILPAVNDVLQLGTAAIQAITPTENLTKKMEEERIKVNSLTSALMDHTISLDVRRSLMQKINDLTPSILDGQKAEKLNYDKLALSLEKYNDQQVKRIVLAGKGEDLINSQKRQANVQKEIESTSQSVLKRGNEQYSGIQDRGDADYKKAANIILNTYNKNRDIVQYGKAIGDLYQTMIEGGSTLFHSKNGDNASDISDLEYLKKDDQYLTSINGSLQKGIDLYAKKNGLEEKPDKKDKKGSGSGDASEIEKAKKAHEARLKETKKLVEDENKIIFDGTQAIETDAKQKAINDLDNKLRLNLEKLNDYKAKTDEELAIAKKFKDKILEYDALQRAAILRPVENTPMGQLANIVGGYKTPIASLPTTPVNNLHELTKNIKEFAKSKELLDSMAGAFDNLGITMVDSFKLADTGIQGFAKNMLKTIMDLASKVIAVELSKALGFAIGGAVASGSATGPAAIWTTPAFIAEAVGGVMGAFAAIPKFANGGYVPGNPSTGDSVLAMLTPGELILNGNQQAREFGNSGNQNNGIGEVIFTQRGGDLVGVLNYHNRRSKKLK